MDWREAFKAADRGRIAPVYLLYGNEDLLMERFLLKIKEKLIPTEAESFDYREVDGRELSTGDVILMADTLPAIASWRVIAIKKPSPAIFNDSDGSFMAYLEKPALNTCLILIQYGTVDKRLKIIKRIDEKNGLIEFPVLKDSEMQTWLQKEAEEQGYNLTSGAAKILARTGNLRLAIKELEKVITYKAEEKYITYSDVQAFLPVEETEVTVFQLVDALGNCNAVLAVSYLRKLLTQGESPLGIVAMLARQLRMIYHYHLVSDKRKLSEILGARPFVIRKVTSQARNFSLDDVENALEELLEADVAVKTGQGEAGAILEKAIWRIILKRDKN